MLAKDKEYLESLSDEQQYSAARCAMDRNCFLFDWESTASVKAMNHANNKVRNAFSIDIVNASIVLLKMESQWFKKQQEMAWKREEPLTPHGDELMKKISEK